MTDLPDGWSEWADLDRYLDLHAAALRVSDMGPIPHSFEYRQEHIGQFEDDRYQNPKARCPFEVFHFLTEAGALDDDPIAVSAWECLGEIALSSQGGRSLLCHALPGWHKYAGRPLWKYLVDSIFARLRYVEPPSRSEPKASETSESTRTIRQGAAALLDDLSVGMDPDCLEKCFHYGIPTFEALLQSSDPLDIDTAVLALGAVADSSASVESLFVPLFERLLELLSGQVEGYTARMRGIAAWAIARHASTLEISYLEEHGRGQGDPASHPLMRALRGMVTALKTMPKEHHKEIVSSLSTLMERCEDMEISLHAMLQPLQAVAKETMDTLNALWTEFKQDPNRGQEANQEALHEMGIHFAFFIVCAENAVLARTLNPFVNELFRILGECLNMYTVPSAVGLAADTLGRLLTCRKVIRDPLDTHVEKLSEVFSWVLQRAGEDVGRETPRKRLRLEREEEEEDGPFTAPIAILDTLIMLLEETEDEGEFVSERLLRALHVPTLCASVVPWISSKAHAPLVRSFWFFLAALTPRTPPRSARELFGTQPALLALYEQPLCSPGDDDGGPMCFLDTLTEVCPELARDHIRAPFIDSLLRHQEDHWVLTFLMNHGELLRELGYEVPEIEGSMSDEEDSDEGGSDASDAWLHEDED